MAYTTPTLGDFLIRFPVFSDSDPSIITALLAEATAQLDQSWREEDYAPAILYLTAHLLATDNSGEGEDIEIGGAQGAISSESFGGLSVSYASPSNNALSDSAQFGSTAYGRRFLVLLRNNRGGPVAI
jgi:hypothetical protein